MQEIGADALGQYQGESHDEGRLGEGHEAYAEHLAREQLNGAHGGQERLDHAAGLLLHDTDQSPGVVLREHHEYQDDAYERGVVGCPLDRSGLEAVNRQ